MNEPIMNVPAEWPPISLADKALIALICTGVTGVLFSIGFIAGFSVGVIFR